MYEAYWQLNHRPFENVSDADFYYPGEGHQGALLKLRYCIENKKGAALLAGDHGSGKTLVVDMLARQLPEEYQPFVHVVFPQMPPADLLSFLAEEFSAQDQNAAPRSMDQSVRSLQRSLAENTERGRHAVIAIDEAHLLEDNACWEALRLLMNFRSNGHPDLTFLLIGQMPVLSTINRMPSWEERLNVKCLLKSLTLDETACYLQHRLVAAGGRPEIYSPEAVTTIHRLAEGMPRRINRLADLALVVGYAEELDQIGAAEVEAVCEELITVGAE
ncbi:General secretion pathway protein A [Planctomycetales bacterium 10988]|nr:General secretion pathway protein A [Planctomycetales bacterium 10988]